jgi:hypothetical protein
VNPRRLWHYTCHHSVEKIIASGFLRPNPHAGHQPVLSMTTGVNIITLPVIWLSDIDVRSEEDKEALGLGKNTGLVTCNRVAYRFRVPSSSGVWWPAYGDYLQAQGTISVKYRQALEYGHTPERWWISEKEISSPRLDERYRR